MTNSLVNDENLGPYTEGRTEIIMKEADLKISIDDLQVLQSIISVVLSEIQIISSVWTDFGKDQSKVIEK